MSIDNIKADIEVNARAFALKSNFSEEEAEALMAKINSMQFGINDLRDYFMMNMAALVNLSASAVDKLALNPLEIVEIIRMSIAYLLHYSAISKQIDMHHYFGGILTNLQAWARDEEEALAENKDE